MKRVIGIQIHSMDMGDETAKLTIHGLTQDETHSVYNQLERVGKKNDKLETTQMYNMLCECIPCEDDNLWYLHNSNVTVIAIKKVIKKERLSSMVLDAKQIVNLTFRKKCLKRLLDSLSEEMGVKVKHLEKAVDKIGLDNAIALLALTEWKEKDKHYNVKYTVNSVEHKIKIKKA